MGNLENALQVGGYFGGISIQRYLNMERLAANGAALANISGRTSGMTAAYFDIFNNLNTYSAGILDNRKTTASQALTAGTTILTDKVVDATGGDSVNGFIAGSELTIQDDEFKEYVTVTNGGVTEDITEYDRSTPITVVSSAYATSASARPQVLSNGWIVSAEYNGTDKIYIQVSKDNGATFSTLCSFDGLPTAANNFSLSSKGKIVYLFITVPSSTWGRFVSFDASTVIVGYNLANIVQTLDSSQTSFGTGCSLAINSTGTELHACFSSKNSSLPNSFNIRYVKGTISAIDGSVSWGSVVQVTTRNTTGYDLISPSITVYGFNIAVVFAHSQTGRYGIDCVTFNGTSWTSELNNLIVSGTTNIAYAQSSPDAICDENGILWVVWQGKDAVDATVNNIHCKYSNDGGITWINSNGVTDKLTSGNIYEQLKPTITFDSNNNIYVLFHGVSVASSTYLQVRKIIYSSSSWGNVTDLTTNTTAHAFTPSICVNFPVFIDPICIYMDNQTSSVKFRGIFTQTTQTPHLEVTPLQNSYKTNVLCYRSLGNVDTVNGRLGFSQGFTSSTTYDRSTPTTVVGSAYDTSGNGGRKLVRLDNGWLVAGVYNSADYKIYFYKSADNGANWTQLCFYYPLATAVSGFAIASSGTTVYTYVCHTADNSSRFIRFDATTVTNVGQSLLSLIDQSQTSFGSGCSLAIDSLGYLHATWCSKNATYPNSFNIRYSKSTDGGVTWSAVVQLTATNSTGTDNVTPTIVTTTSIYPIIMLSQVSSSVNKIWSLVFNGSAWVLNLVYSGTTYAQSNPCAVVDNDGVIHVVWHGYDATDTSAYNIRYSKSTDGGVTWSTPEKRTTGNTSNQQYASITCSTNGDIFIVWSGIVNAYYLIRKIKYSGGVWGSITNISPETGTCYSPSALASSTLNFSEPLVIYKDQVNAKVMFTGIYTDSVLTPFLEEDIRYIIDPPTPVSQLVDWTQYDIDPDFSISNKFSLVATGANESYGNPTLKTTIIEADVTAEDQNVYIAPANSRITKRITLNRTNTSINKSISQLLGAVGY